VCVCVCVFVSAALCPLRCSFEMFFKGRTSILHSDISILHSDTSVLHSDTSILRSDTSILRSDTSILHSSNSYSLTRHGPQILGLRTQVSEEWRGWLETDKVARPCVCLSACVRV
jgi:hypothetical protein